MTALAIDALVDAYPLGRPPCGTLRYGMTQEQALLYQWLVKYRPHDKAFAVGFREAAIAQLCGVGAVHARVMALVERGWLKPVAKRYAFVRPIQHYQKTVSSNSGCRCATHRNTPPRYATQRT